MAAPWPTLLDANATTAQPPIEGIGRVMRTEKTIRARLERAKASQTEFRRKYNDSSYIDEIVETLEWVLCERPTKGSGGKE